MRSVDPFVIGGTVHGLLDFLLTWLSEKSEFLDGLPSDIEFIKTHLEVVSYFPEEEAMEGHPGNSVIRVWRSLLRDAAYKAEELVDEFEYLVSRSPNVRVMRLRKAWFKATTLLEKNRIACRAKLALKEFDEISTEQNKRLVEARSGRTCSSVELQPQRLISIAVDYDDRPFVGMDRERRALVELLEDGERRRVAVGVKGMGGLGKTTLVYSAYSLVKTGFDCCVWLTVSLSYSLPDMLCDLYKQIMGSSPVIIGMNAYEIAERISDGLKKKRYLVVFDDLGDAGFWHEMENLLPNNHRGSRIIITTRNERVACSIGKNGRVLTVSPLSPDHAWDLFFQVAFAETTCPQDIESSARSIVAKCGGLPLAIVTMARLMASPEQSVEEWSSVESKFEWYLHSQKSCEVAKRTLLRSLKNEPIGLRHLKRCFFYLSIFPKDVSIRKKKLIRLWVSEGLVGHDERGWTLEEKAQICLEELISENMVEISTDSSGKETYKMHDVMRELALWAAMEEKFLVIHDGKSADPCCRARRLSIQTRGKNICLDCKGQSHLHSILNFDRYSVINDYHLFLLKKMWSHVKFLRVLDLEGLKISKCPDGLNELFNLRYLSLRKTRIKNMPHGLEKLPSLETIDLRGTELKKIPLGRVFNSMLPSEYVSIKYLQKLRHLLYVGPSPPSNSWYVVPIGIPPPQGVCEFSNLQTLAHIKADEAFVTNVGKLIYLKKFGITNLRVVDGEKLLSSLEKMFTLEHLSITAAPGQPLMLESASSSPPTSIRKLVLIGTMRGGILPTWITSLESLTHLRLRSSKLVNDPLPALQGLLNLELIELRDAYLGKKLNIPARSFFRLKKLELWDLPSIESISIEPNALRDIREMHFYNCKKLRDYPHREDLRYQRCDFHIFN